jgi:hypothetical protein
MRGGTLSVLLLAVVAIAVADDKPHIEHHAAPAAAPDHRSDFEKIDTRLDSLTTRIGKLIENIDSRVDPARIKRAGSLKVRVQRLEGFHCGKREYQCGGDDPECVSNLFICDGHKDCRNGHDEELCDLPTKAGDHFEGVVLWDKCTKRQPEKMGFEIKSVKVFPDFPGIPRLQGNVLIDYEGSDGRHGNVALPSSGYYKFSRHRLVLLAPETDGLGLACQFDGYNTDKCDGEILHEVTGEVCAKIAFQRVTEDDDDDHDHHH